jgi:hypothetical protein
VFGKGERAKANTEILAFDYAQARMTNERVEEDVWNWE